MKLLAKIYFRAALSFVGLMALATLAPAQAQYGASAPPQGARPTSLLTPPDSRRDGLLDASSQERLEMLELKLMQMEQLLNAQNNLRARNQSSELMKLRQRIAYLEAQTPGSASTRQTGDGAAANDLTASGAAEMRMRLNDMGESLRALQAHTDTLLLQVRALTQRAENSKADNEFRFQALESGVRRANTGISSTSGQPEVIGFVRRAAPVEALKGASVAALTDAAAPLVGEGDLSAMQDFGRQTRKPLKDPKALYDRALKDLQAGDYGGAEADFTTLVSRFPSHKLAGNSQYWLGETFYVRRQYKQAAEAFLAGYTTYAQSQKAPDSLLKLGMTLNALGEKKTGCDALAELGAKFPDASSAISKRAQIERKRADCGS